jgi:hypothetical protein
MYASIVLVVVEMLPPMMTVVLTDSDVAMLWTQCVSKSV